MKFCKNKKWLYNQYIVYKNSSVEIAKKCNKSPGCIIYHLRKYNIPVRTLKESHSKIFVGQKNPNWKPGLHHNKNWLYEYYVVKKWPVSEISRLCHVGETTIYRNVKKFKIIKHNKDYCNHRWLYEKYVVKDMTTYNIAKLANVSRTTICNWLMKFNIPTKKDAGKFNTRNYKGRYHHNWKGGITPLNTKIRNCQKYINWRHKIFEKDWYRCVLCKSKKSIQADHIKSFSTILKENKVKSLKDALFCKELWHIDNGRTLCELCHKKKTFNL